MDFSQIPELRQEPILWRLLTTHQINDVSKALECLDELKSCKVPEIESSQLETGATLKKLLVMSLQVALKILTLKLSTNIEHEIKAEEIEFLKILMV
ncbi:hypothetical protein [Marinifilum sp.]|uniref:hypothetical protein n=1 Tax=Marinifilum sp. TaxID=2033137 RepID=UPI003BABA4FB